MPQARSLPLIVLLSPLCHHAAMRLMALLAALFLSTSGLLSTPAQGDEPVVLPLPMDDAARGRAIFNGRGGGRNGDILHFVSLKASKKPLLHQVFTEEL